MMFCLLFTVAFSAPPSSAFHMEYLPELFGSNKKAPDRITSSVKDE